MKATPKQRIARRALGMAVVCIAGVSCGSLGAEASWHGAMGIDSFCARLIDKELGCLYFADQADVQRQREQKLSVCQQRIVKQSTQCKQDLVAVAECFEHVSCEELKVDQTCRPEKEMVAVTCTLTSTVPSRSEHRWLP